MRFQPDWSRHKIIKPVFQELIQSMIEQIKQKQLRNINKNNLPKGKKTIKALKSAWIMPALAQILKENNYSSVLIHFAAWKQAWVQILVALLVFAES